MKSSYLGFLMENRRFLAFGFAMAWFSSYGQTYFISVFGGEIRAEFGLTHGGFGLAYSLATLVSGLCLIWLGRQIDRFDLIPYTVAICVGLIVACGLMATANSVAMLAIAMFALRIMGQGLMSHTALTSMARYFDHDRGKAISIANLGFPAGQAIFPLVGVALAAALGWRDAWLAMTAVFAFALAPLLLWLLKGHGARHARMLERTAAGAGSGRAGAARQWTPREVRRDMRFWLIMPSVVALSFIGTGIIFHQVHLTEIKGWSLAWFAGNYFTMAATMVATALLSGPLIDRIGAARLLPVYLVPAVFSLAVLAGGDALAVVPAFMVLQGISAGLSRVVLGALWAERYGVLHLGAIRALVAASMVIASAASPVAFGWMIDFGIAFDAIIWMCVAYLVIAIALIFVAERGSPNPG